MTLEDMIDKQLAISESIINQAIYVVKCIGAIPKKNKYFFKKKYDRGRSRKDKAKTAIAMLNIGIASNINAMQIRRIISTPIPKFKKGSV